MKNYISTIKSFFTLSFIFFLTFFLASCTPKIEGVYKMGNNGGDIVYLSLKEDGTFSRTLYLTMASKSPTGEVCYGKWTGTPEKIHLSMDCSGFQMYDCDVQIKKDGLYCLNGKYEYDYYARIEK